MWKEAVLVQFKVLSQLILEETEILQSTSVRITSSQAKIWIWYLPDIKQKY